MEDKVFKVDLERSRVYWDYYKSIFFALAFSLMATMICVALIYTKGGLDIIYAAAIIVLLFLCVIFLAALLHLGIWRHENKFLDELIRIEEEDERQTRENPGIPLV